MPVRATEQTLRHCMRNLIRQKNLEQITVGEICETAHIGKRTFYRYYPDKYALLEDTYLQEFYHKLEITEETPVYEVFTRMARQMYEEQEFFRHAINVKGQNGFWTMMSDLIRPRFLNQLDRDSYIDAEKEYYTRKDIDILLHHFENWIKGGYQKTPQELVEYVRLCNALHGKWEYQFAMGRDPDPYSLEKFRKNEW